MSNGASNLSLKTSKAFRQRSYALILALCWTAVVGASFIWSSRQQRLATEEVARSQARAGVDKDVLFRRWNAMHGGVYVPATDATPPNPHLEAADRDITTPGGVLLTLMNPAYMTRQVHELEADTNGIQGHITSLKPIRPENNPDPWEKTALEAFERGHAEYSSVDVFRGEPHLRLMRPLRAEKSCLQCHAEQGYREGDIRGGISSSVPMAPFLAIAQSARISSLAGHLAFWALGLAGISFFFRRLRQYTQTLAVNEARIRESEQRFMDVLYASEDAILLLDNDVFVDCNRAAARMLGYACRDDFLRRNPADLSPPTQPDGRDSREKAQELLPKAFEKGCLRFEWTHRRANGEDFPAEVTLTPITYHGKTILHCLWRDLTTEKLAKQERDRLRATTEKILESLPVGVVIIGPDKIIRRVNSTALTMMGYQSPDEIVGRECHCSLCPAQRDACPIWDLGMTVDNAERVLIDRNRNEIPILKTVIPVTLNEEDVLLETFVDISDRKQAERALHVAKEEAEAANRTKSYFLASMSHELRTPLTGILGFTDLLLTATPDEQQRREYLETIRSSGQHLLELINDILDLSKIEATRLVVERTPCTPHGILNGVVSLMRVQALAKNLDLHFRWASSVPCQITTDGYRLRQILLNLVGNAIKFTQRGSVEIVARIIPSAEQSRFQVDVIDTGIGIPEEKLECIFDPFVQADNSTTRQFEGTGLGLAISARLAKALGGNVTVTSELGVGSTFTVTVEAGNLETVSLLTSPVADGIQAGEEQPTAPNALSLRPGHVLLAEDGHVNRKLISTILERAGLHVTAVENGELAVELAAADDFELILMDMQMPVLNGYDATERLRSQGVTTPIIALTAHAMEGDREKCLAAGCSDYLSKPIAIDALIAAVAKVLGTVDRSDARECSPRTPSSPLPHPLVSSLPIEEPEFCEIVREFVTFLNDLLVDMRQAVKEEDMERLAELSHTLKGSAGTAGFPVFTEPARQLEKLARQGRLQDARPAIEALTELARRIELPPEPNNAFLDGNQTNAPI